MVVVQTFFDQRNGEIEDSDDGGATHFVQFDRLSGSHHFLDLSEGGGVVGGASSDHVLDEVVDGLGKVFPAGNEIGRDELAVQEPSVTLHCGDQPGPNVTKLFTFVICYKLQCFSVGNLSSLV